ncbi:hypothetical protein MNBD_IGNAVI01-2943 [hydrothermal vent metagenome]|uniref:Uncharacterized protein n=1 Tax=hydrothermal vent metagenome TaxID=652676 RepID=A0A3B1D5Q0_9ZZZZ
MGAFNKHDYGKLWNWEHELARPLWFLQTKFDKSVLEKGERFYKVEKE